VRGPAASSDGDRPEPRNQKELEPRAREGEGFALLGGDPVDRDVCCLPSAHRSAHDDTHLLRASHEHFLDFFSHYTIYIIVIAVRDIELSF
jgi:hypothetical protein